MKKIVQNGDPVLRRISSFVPLDEIQSPRIQKIIKEMKKVLATRTDGVGLAAPQIGESLQIFIVSGKVLSGDFDDGAHQAKKKFEDLVFINPEIITHSKEKVEVTEGCLSVEWYFGSVARYKKMKVRAHDEHGKQFTRGGSGLMAQIFQHETDHLNAILFIDRARDLRKLTPEEILDIETMNAR